MSTPSSIERCLVQKGIEFLVVQGADRPMHSLHSSQNLPRHQVAVMILLGDRLGRLQALIPADRMLDLNRLNDLQGRTLKALRPDEIRQLTDKLGVDCAAALPVLQELPIVVDEALLEPERVYIELPERGTCIALSQSEFRKMVKTAKLQHFTVPLARLRDHAMDDTQAIHKAVQQFTGKRIKQRLEQTLEMPPLPDTAENIIALRLNPRAHINDLVKIVERDPSLAAQVVSWASSPYYAAPGGVSSVRDAIVRVLGFDLVVNLSLGLSLGKSLSVPKDGPLSLQEYWRQSVYVAAAMEALVRQIHLDHRPSGGLCYLAGLLHSYGYLVLAHVFPPYLQVINQYIEANPHLGHAPAERHVLGITREQISAQLMECWQMPAEVTSAIRWQSACDQSTEHSIYPHLLFVATQMLRRERLIEGHVEAIHEGVWPAIHMTESDALNVMLTLREKRQELDAIAGNMTKR